MTYLSVSRCLSLLGTVAAMIPMVKWAHWRMRIFQKGFLNQWRKQSVRQKIQLTSEMKKCLEWWRSTANLHKYHQLVPDSPQVITSDASGSGWGAHYNGRPRQVEKLRAALCALKAFHAHIQGTNVVVQMDNRTAVTYVRRQGGTRSWSLLTEVTPIMEWAQ